MTTDKKHKDNLVWIDMEMTGLDPEKEGIIEIASVVTDKDLNVLAEGPNLIIRQPAKLLKAMDSWNQKQHGKSGLLAGVKKSKISVKKAERETLKFIKKFCVPGKTILCGSAIYHDRRFIIKHMPKLNAFLHYRLIDVSTIKELVRRWYPKDKDAPQKSEDHRALSDILESIEELRYYRKNNFK
jgi:oligoribonuclease